MTPNLSQRLRAFFSERPARIVEGLLLLLAFAVLLCGVALVCLTQAPPKSATAPLNINTATAAQLAGRLQVSQAVAKAIVAARPAGGFGDVDALKRLRENKAPLVPPANIADAEDRLVVRPFSAATHKLFVGAAAMAGFFAVTHLFFWWRLPRADPFLLPVAALLCFLSVLLLFALKDPVRDRLSFASQAAGVAFGGGAVFFVVLPVMFSPRVRLHRYTYVYALLAVIACAVLLFAGVGIGGVRLSVAGVQPVEGVKVLLVFFLAAYLAERAPELSDALRRGMPRAKDFLPLLVMYALTLGLFVIVRDLGPVLLLFGVFVTLLYVATGRGVYVATGVMLLLLGGYFGYQTRSGVFPTRLDMWLSPWNNTHPQGDHLALGLWGMASGGPLGSGLGLGAPRLIPRGGSDLVLASLGEETGIAGTLTLLVCFLVLVARGFVIARNAATVFDRYLAAGIATLFGLQSLLIVSGTLGLFPLSGVTLPFVSFGKSSLVASLLSVGVLIYLSARSRDGTVLPVSTEQEREQERAMRGVGLFFFVFLGLVCAGRLLYTQAFAADAIAGRIVTVPGADKLPYPHGNPRLRLLAAEIRRGKLLDRAGAVLAFTDSNRVRVYPLGAAAAHTVGYLQGGRGIVGMESRFEERLRGYKDAASLIPVWRTKDAPGFRLPQGADVTLALDARLQIAAASALRASGKPRGAAVVIDPRTGAVLAAATLPTFDPNTLTPAILAQLNANRDNNFALINRATGGYYPPGSTFKVVSASALLATGRGDFATDCAHATRIAWRANGQNYSRRRIADDEGERAHGATDLRTAVSESCNVYFARAGIALEGQTLRDHAASYGFSKLPTATQFDAALPEIAFGQGEMLATPLEMAGVAGTIASGGIRFAPVWEKSAPATVATTPLSPPAARQIADMMRETTRTGTAAGRFDDLGFAVAGKTGTAQNNEGNKRSHAWFIGFAPAENPRVAFAVIVENGGYGAATAVPVAREILHTPR